MHYKIEEIKISKNATPKQCREFCLSMINHYYGISYRADYHSDLDSLIENPSKNWFSRENRGQFLVATSRMGIIGTIGIYDLSKKPETYIRLADRYNKKEVCQLVRAYVSPDFQGIGIGKKLVEAVEEGAVGMGYNSIYLHADAKNLRTLAFWENRLFQSFNTHEEKDYIDFDKRDLHKSKNSPENEISTRKK